MRSHLAFKTAELEPRATPTNEFAQLPTQAATAPVFTYVTPPAPSNQSLDSAPRGGPDSGFTPPIEAGISLGVCVVLVVAGLLIYRFNMWRSNRRSKVNQDSTAAPCDLNPSMSQPPAQHMSSRQREKMPASNTAFQTTVDDDEIRPVTPQKAILPSEKGGRADDDSSSMVISPC